MAIMEEQELCPLLKPPSTSRLHNFTFPTPTWGEVRLLRCMKKPTVRDAEIKEAPSTSGADHEPISAFKGPENAELPWNLRRRVFSKVESSKPDAGFQRKEKRKLTICLSFEEIEADFLLMTGKKPCRRSKKRPRRVQRKVDAVVPGLRLSVVTFDMYKVVV